MSRKTATKPIAMPAVEAAIRENGPTIPAAGHWIPPKEGVLLDLWLPHVDVYALDDGRWSRSGYVAEIAARPDLVFQTRAGAIRATVAIAIRNARTQHRTPRDLYDTNPAFDMSAEQLRAYVGWLRGIVAAEAPRDRAAIERYESAVARSLAWIAAREEVLGVVGMTPDDFRYPPKLVAARAKVAKLESALAKLKTPIAEKPAPGPTDVADLLVAAGIAPSADHLRMYGIPRVSPEPEFPSRMYAFPVGYVAGLDDEPDRVFLKDESLQDLPRAREIADAVGERLEVWHPGLPASFGLSYGRWHHATDLMTDQHHGHLLATRHLTTDEAIDTAVAHGLMHPPFDETRTKHGARISVATARKVLTAIGIPEPEDRSAARILGDGLHYAEGTDQINPTPGAGKGWMLVHMVEDGWAVRERSGFLKLSAKAIEARRAHREKPVANGGEEMPTQIDMFVSAA